jgi:uncharacterized protein YndB with AHSA1/START domain
LTATTDREIVVSRVFDAPKETVFAAFTGDGIEQWWGPNGFTTTTSQRDVRVGGEWIFVMHGPDGTDYDNRIVYTGIHDQERLEYDHFARYEAEPHFKATVTFNDVSGGTEVALHLLFPTSENRDEAAKYGIEGGHQTLGRLAEFLATQ